MVDKSEFDARLACAKMHRKNQESNLREATKFLFNGREVEWDSRSMLALNKYDPEEIFDTEAAEANEDFAADLFMFMTPDNQPWLDFEIGAAIPEEFAQQIEAEVEAHIAGIDKAISVSNYYDEGPTAFQSAGLGLVAMWIDSLAASRPAVCEAIPLSECYFTIGPKGLEDRFRDKSVYARDIPVLFPEYAGQFSDAIRQKIRDGKKTVPVTWGFWRDYSDPADPQWMRQIKIDTQYFPLERIGGEGSCPFTAGRFNAQPNRAWGFGPAIRMLPNIRTLDAIKEMVLNGMDRNLDPAYTYPHDGLIDLSDGIEPGRTYPVAANSTVGVTPIGTVDNLDYGFFSEEMQRSVIRRGFYRPEDQKGKTPPSASQYLGEEQKPIRRMIAPAKHVWSEFVVGMIRRFEFLEVQAGRLQYPAIGADIISLTPVSPLHKSQNREEVIAAQGIMAMAKDALGEQTGLVIDGIRTIGNIKRKLNDTIVQVRSEKEIMQLMSAMNGGPATPNSQP